MPQGFTGWTELGEGETLDAIQRKVLVYTKASLCPGDSVVLEISLQRHPFISLLGEIFFY